jgi:hypothetical protein
MFLSRDKGVGAVGRVAAFDKREADIRPDVRAVGDEARTSHVGGTPRGVLETIDDASSNGIGLGDPGVPIWPAAGGIVSALEDARINSAMASDGRCPIALWFAARLNAEIRKGTERVRACRGQCWTETIMPRKIAVVVGRFDAGCYPQLVSPFRPNVGPED